MVKYFCDHCQKMINERRKSHHLSEIHKKNKDLYYNSFSTPLSPGLTPWVSSKSLEELLFEKYLKQVHLPTLYTLSIPLIHK